MKRLTKAKAATPNFWSPERLIKATIIGVGSRTYPVKMRWDDRYRGAWIIFKGGNGILSSEGEGTYWIRGWHADDSNEVKVALVTRELSR